jgi:hypothetical protein
MPQENRENIKRLQEAIRKQRVDRGLPAEGTLRPDNLLDTLKRDPPIEKIVAFVRESLERKPAKSKPNSQTILPPSRFDKRA